MKNFQVAYIPIGVPTFHLESAQTEFDKSVSLLTKLSKSVEADLKVPSEMLLSIDKLKAFIETIAGQWARLGIKTAREAMKEAEKEYKKKPKKEVKNVSKLPVWFGKDQTKEEISEEEQKEMENLLKEFR